MRTIQISGIDLPASVIGLGTMIFHPDTARRDWALLDAFVAGGGTFIDTAEVYGAVEEHGYSEMVIGDWLAARPGMRQRIVLASKGLIPGYCAPLYDGGASIGPDQVHRAIDGSLARLRTSWLDVWMFHRDDPAQDVGPLVDALDHEIKAGRLRAWAPRTGRRHACNRRSTTRAGRARPRRPPPAPSSRSRAPTSLIGRTPS